MDGSLVAIFEILDVLLDVSRVVDREEVTIAGEVIERITVYSIRRLFRGKEEDGARFCVSIVRSGCETGQ